MPKPLTYRNSEMNQERASWAQSALTSFQSLTFTDDEDAICDLLCDMMHLCHQSTLYGDFANALRRAEDHFTTEAYYED